MGNRQKVDQKTAKHVQHTINMINYIKERLLMKYQSVAEAWGKEYEKVCGEPASESQNQLFAEIAGLMEMAYNDGVQAGALKAQGV